MAAAKWKKLFWFFCKIAIAAGIVGWLIRDPHEIAEGILERGALERFFRPEGKMNDNIHAHGIVHCTQSQCSARVL